MLIRGLPTIVIQDPVVFCEISKLPLQLKQVICLFINLLLVELQGYLLLINPRNLPSESIHCHDLDRSIRRVACLFNLHVQLMMVMGSSSRAFVQLPLVLSVPQFVLLVIVSGSHRVFGSSGVMDLLLHFLAFLVQMLGSFLLVLALSLRDLCSGELLVTFSVLDNPVSVCFVLLPICFFGVLTLSLLPLFGFLLL